jgi:hypothetical protein
VSIFDSLGEASSVSDNLLEILDDAMNITSPHSRVIQDDHSICFFLIIIYRSFASLILDYKKAGSIAGDEIGSNRSRTGSQIDLIATLIQKSKKQIFFKFLNQSIFKKDFLKTEELDDILEEEDDEPTLDDPHHMKFQF